MDEVLARIVDPAYVADLPARPIEEIRAMRAECSEVETGISYLRRMAQARMDIVGAELARRSDGGDPADIAALIDRLPAILAEHLRAPGNGRLPTTLGPGRVDPELGARLDAIVAEGQFDALAALPDERLDAVRTALVELEHDLSARRKVLFERLDALQAELTRRYKAGEASVESLLR